MTPDEIKEIQGARELIDWFGSWPRFLDAEVLDLHLMRSGLSQLQIHTFDGTGEVGEGGFFILHKHVVITFLFEHVNDCELTGFNHQNVINGSTIERQEDRYQLKLNDIFGLGGAINAESIQIKFEPGKPMDK